MHTVKTIEDQSLLEKISSLERNHSYYNRKKYRPLMQNKSSLILPAQTKFLFEITEYNAVFRLFILFKK